MYICINSVNLSLSRRANVPWHRGSGRGAKLRHSRNVTIINMFGVQDVVFEDVVFDDNRCYLILYLDLN